ncbi:hypothetical protein CDAR_559181 [Caerostris darwini]|uniref:Uncharacterized protein n=1 Tax=Caerostris darwini TaxID=1538125 RepID=A0AAV4P330_9ARAC|nr:hypothetical protein CDAR_559181 [Caerostris darwini]
MSRSSVEFSSLLLFMQKPDVVILKKSQRNGIKITLVKGSPPFFFLVDFLSRVSGSCVRGVPSHVTDGTHAANPSSSLGLTADNPLHLLTPLILRACTCAFRSLTACQ